MKFSSFTLAAALLAAGNLSAQDKRRSEGPGSGLQRLEERLRRLEERLGGLERRLGQGPRKNPPRFERGPQSRKHGMKKHGKKKFQRFGKKPFQKKNRRD
jgi:hypothetical protein